MLSSLRDGAAYTIRTRAIAYVLFLQAVLAVCARPVGELLPAFVGSVFSMGAEVLAVLTSAMGIGAVVAGLRMLLWDSRGGAVSLVFSSTLMSAVTVILFALTSNIWLAAVVIGLVGYWVTVCGIVSQTLIQTCVDKEMRGRVISLWAAIYRGAPGIGALLIGWLSGIFGLMWPNVIAASCCFLAAIWMVGKRPVMDKFYVARNNA